MSFKKNGSLTMEQIIDAEEKIGHKIPEDYKQFLLKTNGGRIDFVNDEAEHKFHVDLIEEDDVWLDSLYGIGESARDWLVYFNNEYGHETKGCLIIGDTLCHGFILYDYLGIWSSGGIYFWDDKLEYKSSREGNLYFVAKNFNDFMEICDLKIN